MLLNIISYQNLEENYNIGIYDIKTILIISYQNLEENYNISIFVQYLHLLYHIKT